MWNAISKIFTKNNSKVNGEVKEAGDMDRGEDRRPDMDMQDAYDTRQAKQRASIKWLLAKAFNNKVPENLKEPFYRDHENQERLKPQIVGALANAEMYCLALGNIYSDPNYHNLNHWSILQTLARKGIYVSEPSDGSQLTETTLIQTNPLKMSAHMAVIESIMTLYAKEVVTPDRVLAAVHRFNHGKISVPPTPDNYEQGLLLWVTHACTALKKRIEQELDSTITNGGGEGDRLHPPELPPIKEFKDLCDGVGLAALISYYCSDELPWSKLLISYLPTVSESLHNLRLVQNFCQRCLPTSVFHLMPEDITYMRGSMKQNLIVFLADLFNVLEIHPANCVRYPGMDKSTSVSKSTPTHVPLKKTNSLQQSVSEFSEDSLRRGSEDSFVVHKSKNIPTLSSVIYDEPLVPARLRVNKEVQNHDSKAEERGDKVAAGRPSNWNENKTSYSGRRSRRNSVTEDSQLTIENFGGSQDNINFIGRNPDKEVGAHVGRKISAPAAPVTPVENPAVRSTVKDNRSSIQIGYDNGCEKVDDERDRYSLKRQLSSDAISIHNKVQEKENILNALIDGEVANRMSFAELNKQKIMGDSKAIQLVYMQHDTEEVPNKSSFLNKTGNTNGSVEKKTTTFATLPNTTTWQQQSTNNMQNVDNNMEENPGGNVMTSQLNDIRMKLEEKRRHIENEKRRMEVIMSKQRQKVGKAAFLQAVTKGKGNILKTPSDSESSSAAGSEPRSPTVDPAPKLQRPLTLQDVTDDVTQVERKWFDQEKPFIETRRTPDIENMDLEQYQQSVAQMNSSLQDIQADIQRLASQQSQIQATQQSQLQAAQQSQIQAAQQQAFVQQKQQQLYQPQPVPQYTTQQSYNQPQYQPQGAIYNPLQSYSSAPHLPQFGQQNPTSPRILQDQGHFYLHDQQQPTMPSPPVAPPRRTWAQQANDSYHQPEVRTWSKPQNPTSFMLHDTSDRFQDNSRYIQDSTRFNDSPIRYQNGEEYPLNRSNSHPGFTLSQQHMQQQLIPGSHGSPSTSPQHRNVHRQISQLMDESKRSPVSLQQMDNREVVRKSNIIHAPIPAPPADDMEPQSISFIGKSDDQLSEGISRLNITSGNRTYRIPSPTRPLITRNSFQPSPPLEREPPISEGHSGDDSKNEKGFYISFDNEQPKRPKPPLRMKKMSPKKERGFGDSSEDNSYIQTDDLQDRHRDRLERQKQLERELNLERIKKEERDAERKRNEHFQRENIRQKHEASQEKNKVAAASAIIIGNDLSNPDPDTIDERERLKEKIMLKSLQRRQQQEEARQRKEQEAQTRREREKAKEEDRQRRKEEQEQRRLAIFEQYKMRKAIEEAEKDGKVYDKSELMSSLKPTPKMRPKGPARPRPKTIHIDSGSVEMAEGMLQPSRGKKGSSSNLTAYTPTSTMKRDYYRGSQDSLTDSGRMSSGLLYRGSSMDQDSFAYRYGDTDSGLGRATPPRRAPSPGMGPMRHLPSPSGPGSLPGLMSKRRIFDDGSSDISSTPSSMMDYTGPRLYKQPATKSNRGIMLNAVEYCVFPGVVNKEAKRRVLEEMNRSEAKHFLILFRDAGCQFRALYSYCPDQEEVSKLYGTGPKQVNDRMFDKFFKYNSGGKCFSQVHTKHLTVTIDAFTIHNSLWQGKKVNLPNKKDMALVI